MNTKAYFVRPDGFEVADKATNFHKFSHEHVECEGRPLADVLREFMVDVKTACAAGGRVAAHQLEFDAGVIWQDRMQGGRAVCRHKAREEEGVHAPIDPVQTKTTKNRGAASHGYRSNPLARGHAAL